MGFAERGAVDKVIEKRANHLIDNKWLEVKRHDGKQACAGRAASLTKDDSKIEDEELDQDDLEYKWTEQYLTMAQQMRENFGAPAAQDIPGAEPKEPEPLPEKPMLPPPPPPPVMNMCGPVGMAQPMDRGRSQELMVTGFMAVDAGVLGISGGPPGLMVGVPILSNGQPAVPIPGFSPGSPMMAQGASSFGPARSDMGLSTRVSPLS